jgi:DHA1 family tetracycline resistance protein-like MFS transporter
MNQKKALLMIFCTLFIDVIGLGIIVPVLPKLLEQFTQGDAQQAAYFYGFLLAIYALTQFLFAPIVGALSDRFGRRPVLLMSLVGFGVDYFLMAFAPSLLWFVIARVFSGMMGASYSVAMSYIADVSNPEDRTKNFGLVGVAFGLGFIIGPAISAWLGHYDLRWPFLLSGCLAWLNAVGVWLWLGESLPASKRRPVVFKQLNPFGALVRVSAVKGVFHLLSAYWFAGLAHRILETFWVIYVGYKFNWQIRDVAISLVVVGVLTAIVQGALVRPIVKRFGEQKTVRYGLLLEMLSFPLFAFVSQPWMLFAVLPFTSLGGVAEPAIQSLASGRVGERFQGGLQGVIASFMSITGIIAPILATTLFGFFSGKSALFEFPGMPFVLGAIFYCFCLILIVRYEKQDYNR